MRIIFMGTPDFAVPVLDALKESGQDVCLVVTQPDRAKGRGKSVLKTPVKLCAEKWDIPVFQPEKVKRPEAVERLREEKPDLIVVAAFGQILSQEILDLPKYGCVNVHASLLPKYRGAAPIQWAVINGEEESGVTIMQMNAGLDTGDIIAVKKVTIEPKETGESLYDKLAAIGGELLVHTLPSIENETAVRTPQDDSKSCYAGMLSRELGLIDWSKDAATIERLVRGLNSWPSAYTSFAGKQLKIWDADVFTELPGHVNTAAGDSFGESAEGVGDGTVLGTDKEHIYVKTGSGILALREVQLEGKKRMPVSAFLLGTKMIPGVKLGE